MSNDMDNMRVFADQLWKYMVPKLRKLFSSNVSYFRAQVVSNPGDGTLVIQRPVETGTLTLPCVDSVAHAQPGQQVVALVMGSLSNAIVVGDGTLNIPVSTYGPSNVVTLEAGKGGMPFSGLVSDIVAAQEGSGEPSPENVRPINGFTEMNLHLNNKVITVSFESAGTVYGGTLDVLTGTLTVDRVCKTLTGTGIQARGGATTAAGNYRFYCTAATSEGILLPPNAQTAADVLCSVAVAIPHGDSSLYGVSVNRADSRIYLHIQECGQMTLVEFRTWVDSHAVQVLYRLAEPITYQLAPQQISSFPGHNTIWSDTGDVTVEYGSFVQAMQQEIERLN
jgi:hypothetical protein